MLTILGLIVISISSWTAFVLIKGGKGDSEIRQTLKDILSGLQTTIMHFVKLIRLLTKISLQTISDSKEKNEPAAKESNDQVLETKINEKKNKNDLMASEIEEEEEDLAISNFTPEVIDLINEEEEKVA